MKTSSAKIRNASPTQLALDALTVSLEWLKAALDEEPDDFDNQPLKDAVKQVHTARKALREYSPVDTSATLAGALDQCVEQMHQMNGMFNDSDGTIASAIKDGEDALDLYKYTANPPTPAVAAFAPVLAARLESLLECCELNMDDMEPATIGEVKAAENLVEEYRRASSPTATAK